MVNSPKKSDSKIKYFCHICKRDFVSKAKIYKSAYRAHTGRSKFHKEKSALLYHSQSRNGKSGENESDVSEDDDNEIENGNDDNEVGGENNMDENDYEAFDDTPAGDEVDVASEESDDELKDDVDERDEDESEVL